MKVLNTFQGADGRQVFPGETFNAEGYDEDEVQGLKDRGYIGDGDGFEPGKPNFAKMQSNELRRYARAQGIDDSTLHGDALRKAVETRHVSTTQAAPGAATERAVITFGPKVTPKVETVSADDPDAAKKAAEGRQEDVKATNEQAGSDAGKPAEKPAEKPAPSPAPNRAPAPGGPRGAAGTAPGQG